MKFTKRIRSMAGFTLIEMVFSILVLGIILVAFAGIFILFQKSSAATTGYAEAQQNARIAVDFISDILRQAGSRTDYYRSQQAIVHAGPYQVAVNADVDNGQTIDGLGPLSAIHPAHAPNTVPPSGTIIYTPSLFESNAETIVLTIDSNDDGVVSAADRGDDPEEMGPNQNLFVLRRVTYGFNGSRNEVRPANLALVRGPNVVTSPTTPEPLFQYWYDHDDDPATADLLWGDANGNGVIDAAEAGGVTPVTAANLPRIRKIRTTAVAESNKYDKRYDANGGFLAVSLNSEVYVRNAERTSSNVYGRVFHDIDENGELNIGETGIYNVEVAVLGTSRSTRTDNFGNYYLTLPPGDYQIKMTVPAGYHATTPTLIAASLASGQSQVVNFGIRSNLPIGVIRGVVYDDQNWNQVRDIDEVGIFGATVSLDNGLTCLTESDGSYLFSVQQGTYIVMETDPIGYGSTTSNSVPATIANEGDTITVDFGDISGMSTGTLHGYVFLDLDSDMIRDAGEDGIPNVMLRVSSGDSTLTDTQGYYRFNLAPGTYDLTEIDPPGYMSTTWNVSVGIVIVPDTTVTRNFGDIVSTTADFVSIYISNTDRVLSVAAGDLQEDTRNDPDIVLGTVFTSGIGNILVFQNQWTTSSTPITSLFLSDPTYRRDAGKNINTMSVGDLSGDGVIDVATGLESTVGANVQTWLTASGGLLGTLPNASYLSSGSNYVLDSKLADLNGDGRLDLITGLKSSAGTYTGGFQVYLGNGDGTLASHQYVTTACSSGLTLLGEIWAVETGDMDGDGDLDIVVGSHTTAVNGCIDIYHNDGSGSFTWNARYLAPHAVNDIKVVDMMEDDAGDLDIVAAVASGTTSGYILLWHNNGGVFGAPDMSGYVFGPCDTPRWPTDQVNAGGAALCLGIIDINLDVFPDIAFGTRSSTSYKGDIYVLPSYGLFPSAGQKINKTTSGEVLSMDIADLNKDNYPDIVAGTRTSATQGKLVAYFMRLN